MAEIIEDLKKTPLVLYILGAGILLFVLTESFSLLIAALIISWLVYSVKKQGLKFNPENLKSFSQQQNTFFNQGRTSSHQSHSQAESMSLDLVLVYITAHVLLLNRGIKKSELNHVKRFFRNQFPDDKVKQMLAKLKATLDSGYVPIRSVLINIDERMRPQVKVELFKYLVGLAQSDGVFDRNERAALFNIGIEFGLPFQTIQQMLGINFGFGSNQQWSGGSQNTGQKTTQVDLGTAYRTLGVKQSDDERTVKRAYRALSKKHHPDAGGNKEQFLKIQEAYEAVKKDKGIN